TPRPPSESIPKISPVVSPKMSTGGAIDAFPPETAVISLNEGWEYDENYSEGNAGMGRFSIFWGGRFHT
ncbi:MAG: hypothetical protein KJ831_19805, partial [Candidatus Eisenbacteria bacterium]|nr:hypothetical protein [Candidatus Eisenbacteria bacterium]